MTASWKNVLPEEKERLAGLYKDKKPLGAEAELLSMNTKTLERQIRNYLYYQKEFAIKTAHGIIMPPSPSKQYTDFLQLEGDDWMIISDTEIPDHNPEYLVLALITAMRHNIKKLIIAGDLIATDQKGLVAWVATWTESGELNYEDAIALVKTILGEFQRWFDEIYLIEGNHDDRIARATQGQVHLGMFLTGSNIWYSRYAYLHLNTSRGLVWVVHPQNFSGDPITLAQKLHNTHSPKGHWVVAHCHRRQDGWTSDGQFEIHTLGTGRDSDKTKYKATQINSHKAWDNSFLMILNGWHHPLDVRSTDWKTVLGDFHPVYLNQLTLMKMAAAA